MTGARRPSDVELPRLDALAKLPLFFNLAGRRTLIVGGGAGAAWKAELLAAAGSNVDVVSPDAGEEMQALLARGAAAGHLALHARDWTAADLAGCALAIGDFEHAEEAERFQQAGKAAGTPVNTVDKPQSCDFQFGSIVNRSPVIVAISTDGAAPILGQVLRQRIEALLPRTLGKWGELAQALRQSVKVKLSPGGERRRFWETFSARVFSGEAPPAAGPATTDWVESIRQEHAVQGRVTLVGAGPGDPDLLTLKAMRALQSADVILFDDLVSKDVLELARREAKRIVVGKRGQRESCKQGDINTLMLELARQGKHVVRLKSGDPMIFGRAGEEIAHLEAGGIPVSVVPGITAAQGLAMTLGASLTHRDHAQSLTLITGHAGTGDLPTTIDWKHAASPHVTTIIYMGARMATKIREALLDAGASPEMPVVAGASLSGTEESLWYGSLAQLPEGVARLPHGAAVLIGVGRVFARSQP